MEFTPIAVDGCETAFEARDVLIGLRAYLALGAGRATPSVGQICLRRNLEPADAVALLARRCRAVARAAALLDLQFGAGAVFMVGRRGIDLSDISFELIGQACATLDGRLALAPVDDVEVEDLAAVRRTCPYIVGLGGAAGSGDPAPLATFAMQACLKIVARLIVGNENLAGRRVVVTSLTRTGRSLARHLREAGCRVTVSDPDPLRCARFAEMHGAIPVPAGDVMQVPCDFLLHTDLERNLEELEAGMLRCKALITSRVDALEDEETAARLQDEGIFIAPPLLSGSGALIGFDEECRGHADDGVTLERIRALGGMLIDFVQASHDSGETPHALSILSATERQAEG